MMRQNEGTMSNHIQLRDASLTTPQFVNVSRGNVSRDDIDDAFLGSHAGCINTNSQPRAIMPLNREYDIEQPIAPWSLLFAWMGLASALTLILYIVLMGGLNLG